MGKEPDVMMGRVELDKGYDATDRGCNGWKRSTFKRPGRMSLDCIAKAVDLQISNLEIKGHGFLTEDTEILVDGEDPGEWISKVVVTLQVGEAPRLHIEGPIVQREEGG